MEILKIFHWKILKLFLKENNSNLEELNNEAYEDITTQDNPTPQTAGQAQESQRLSNSPQAASQPVQSPRRTSSNI